MDDDHDFGDDNAFEFEAGGAEEVNLDDALDYRPQSRAQALVAQNPENPCKFETEIGEKLKPVTQHVVASFQVGAPLKLQDIAARVRIVEYRPNKFRFASMSLTSPKCLVNIYASGKGSVKMCKDPAMCLQAAKKTVKLLRRVGYPEAKLLNYRVVTMVSATNLRVPIRLADLHTAYPQWTSYAPEVFPSVRFHMTDPKCVASVFVNGKIILVGHKGEKAAQRAVRRLLPILRPYCGAVGDEASVEAILGPQLGPTKEVEEVEYEEEEAPPSKNVTLEKSARTATSTLAPDLTIPKSEMGTAAPESVFGLESMAEPNSAAGDVPRYDISDAEDTFGHGLDAHDFEGIPEDD